ncbi:MAG: hypothetical protein V8T27_08485, partial [Ruminococcus bicirculans (ex Wegman et al. 2014)]
LDTRHPLKWFIPQFSEPVIVDENGERPADRDNHRRPTMTSGLPDPDGTRRSENGCALGRAV